MADTAVQDHKLDLSTPSARGHVDRMLDSAVEDSFPASDPVSLSMPHDRVESKMQGLKNLASRVETPSSGTMMIAGGILLTLVALIVFRRR